MLEEGHVVQRRDREAVRPIQSRARIFAVHVEHVLRATRVQGGGVYVRGRVVERAAPGVGSVQQQTILEAPCELRLQARCSSTRHMGSTP